jgi:hypothetical protein
MKDKTVKQPHKRGANRNETAVKARKHDPNFKQSRDLHEDRSRRQIKMSGAQRIAV